ncbi:hypothetical protein QIT55_gp39 [Nitrosopumilus spindle-shaped virus]|uniref:Uncharacterized protein n=1 Tax=Nitrosopumilus spindle-shaped virus 1 TaxID=2848002 RepID=A0A514K311_9VIRU|nr:hypothetical protein QIT55_gp39 [Nitrosopumilus spindle-shaped virus]QDI74025.1 hypothetical protein [Nitrosopumilus spindle-shaped virus]
MREVTTLLDLFEKEIWDSKKLRFEYTKGHRKIKIILLGKKGSIHGSIELEIKDLVSAIVKMELLQ